MKIYDTEEKIQQFLLVGVDTSHAQISMEASLDELEELLTTAGARSVGRVIQNLPEINHRTYIGTGKMEEIKTLLSDTGADGIICDDELTPAQLRNLSEYLECKVIDRTLLILDIFTQRAHTREGKLQVELAQLTYRLTRLTGLGTELSRQGAAVGTHTRGAGETKLEMDRRHIRERIDQLKSELMEVSARRDMERSKRKKGAYPIVALVGYTNAGKSTLFNSLTGSHVLEEDKLFATLDTTVRKAVLNSGRTVLYVDTVGFIHKLPHQLVNAFRSTLEEAAEADVLLHVVDRSDPKAAMQMKVTYDELVDLGAADVPILTIWNKQDLVKEETPLAVPYKTEGILKISALEADAADQVSAMVDELLNQQDQEFHLLLPYPQSSLIEPIHRDGIVLQEEYTPEGISLIIRAKGKLAALVKPFERN
ncbi:MAG: GTPase HflX [Firmicutes bacterium]|nr:GTPase HflX [Bacillota bacterium]